MMRCTIKAPVLAVSEDPQTLVMIAGILRQDPMLDIRPARSFEEAWRSAGQQPPELLILDLRAAAGIESHPVLICGDGPPVPVPSLVVCETVEVPLAVPLLG